MTANLSLLTRKTPLLILFPLLVVAALAAPSVARAQGAPSVEEVRKNTLRYLAALQEKGQRTHVFNANRILKFLETNPQAAVGMYMGYKGEWDKILGWEETKSQKGLKGLHEFKRTVEAISSPTDGPSFTKYEHGWRRMAGDADYHLRTYCQGATDDTCPKAKAMRDEAVNKTVESWKLGLRTKEIPFDVLQDVLIEAERETIFEKHTDLDRWIPQLAQEKLAYWRELLPKGLAAYAKSERSHTCVPTTTKGGRDVKAQELSYLFKSSQTAHIRCHFQTAPKTFKRDAKDYWRVSIHWAGNWEKLLVYDIARPASVSSVSLATILKEIPQEIQKRMRTGNKYPGNWVRVEVAYITPYIKGHRWEGGVKVPVWNHGRVTGTSFFMRWR